MKTVLIFMFLFQFQAFSQCDTSNAVDFPDVDAEFPGGIAEMRKFIQQNIEYSPIQRCSLDEFVGSIYIEFIVCSDGTINSVFCKRGSNTDLDQMAIDLVKKMPNWLPAEVNNQPVSSKCRFPIIICLQ